MKWIAAADLVLTLLLAGCGSSHGGGNGMGLEQQAPHATALQMHGQRAWD